MLGGGGPRPNAGRKKGSKDLKPRVRRSQTEIALAAAGVDAELLSWDARGDRKAIDLASAVLNGNPPDWVEVTYPLNLDAFIRLAYSCAPYQSPRLSSIAVQQEDEAEKVKFIRRLHASAMEANVRDEAIRRETGQQLEGVLVKLSEDDAAVVRKATGLLPVNGHAQARLPKP